MSETVTFDADEFEHWWRHKVRPRLEGEIDEPPTHLHSDGDVAVSSPDGVASDLLEAAMGIISNAGGGNWFTQGAEWEGAAQRWAADYHRFLDPNSPVLEEGIMTLTHVQLRLAYDVLADIIREEFGPDLVEAAEANYWPGADVSRDSGIVAVREVEKERAS